METVKMGKRGTLVLPAKLRKQFGLEDGSLLVTEVKEGEIRLRPAVAYEVEIYTPERKAELLLNSAMTKEEWDEIALDIRSWGLDPMNIPGVDRDQREKLRTDKEWSERVRQAKADSAKARRSV
ncbi:MAG: AbrB/MazE/SpoVT family DNA-binding domain-containing protein [Acidobacteria bacterium]|nr:AbrB/MazE/SpoVT family DNA-binding domain-containing protein [Acidobacteriota bacterium]